jgi:hypothetical protein
MRSLKEILEGLLSGQEQTIEIGNNFQNRNDLIESWKKHYINFNVFIKEHFMKDAKSYKHKTGPQYDYSIEGFDNKKKYFFIVKEAVRYDMTHPLTARHPKLAKFVYSIYINDDAGNIGRNMLTGQGSGSVVLDISYYHKNGKYYPMHEYKKSVGNFMFDFGKNKAEVYEVPKQYEWLYDYIKERKLR